MKRSSVTRGDRRCIGRDERDADSVIVRVVAS